MSIAVVAIRQRYGVAVVASSDESTRNNGRSDVFVMVEAIACIKSAKPMHYISSCSQKHHDLGGTHYRYQQSLVITV